MGGRRKRVGCVQMVLLTLEKKSFFALSEHLNYKFAASLCPILERNVKELWQKKICYHLFSGVEELHIAK